jgi:uncharacterized protein
VERANDWFGIQKEVFFMNGKKKLQRVLAMAVLGMTCALGVFGAEAQAAPQTKQAKAAVQTKEQGGSPLKLTKEWG